MAIERSVRINVETGNAKSELNGLSKSLRDTDIAAKGAKTSASGMESELDSLGAAAAKAAKQNNTLGKSFDNTRRAAHHMGGTLGEVGRGAGQAGIQLQQFIGQIQGGVNPMVALSQQGADLGFVLGAPLLGAVVGIGASLAGILAPALFGAKDAAKDLETEFKDLISRYDELTAAQQRYIKSKVGDQVKDLKDKLNALNNEAESLRNILSSPIRFSDEDLKRYSDRLIQLESDIDSTKESIKGFQDQTDGTSKKVVSLAQNIAILQLKYKDMNKEAAIANALFSAGDKINDVNRKKIADLAAQEYDLQQAIEEKNKKERESQRLADKAARQAERQKLINDARIKSNKDLVDALGNQLAVAYQKTSRDQAILTAEMRLNSDATKEQRIQVADLAGKIYDLQQATKAQVQTYDELKSKLDPVSALSYSYLQVAKDIAAADLSTAQQRELLILATNRYKDALVEAQKQQQLQAATEQTYFGAFQQGINDSLITAKSSYDQIREAGQSAIGDLSQSITDFIAKGEGDFRQFASNVVAELLKIQTQRVLTEGFQSLTSGGGISDLFGGAAAASTTTTGGSDLNLGSLSFGDTSSQSASDFRDSWSSSLDDVSAKFSDTFSMANEQSNAFNESTDSVASSISSSLTGSLVKMATQLVTNATIGQAVQSTATAAGAASAAALASAWAPAAAAVSLASYGANSPPAIAGMTAAYTTAESLSAAGGVAKFANGGVINLSDASNSIVRTPTKFAMGGTTGQMGEAGPEAILPLQRTAGGELGVKAMGQQQAQTINVQPPEVNVRLVNVAENPQDYLGSAEGEKQIINIMNRNRQALGLG